MRSTRRGTGQKRSSRKNREYPKGRRLVLNTHRGFSRDTYSPIAASAGVGQQQIDFQLKGVKYSLYLGNYLEWMDSRPANSIHTIVTDPPYGLKEYTAAEKHKLRKGKGGVWRIPPSFDGCTRSPLPRFTVLSDDERDRPSQFFSDFARRAFARIGFRRAHIHCDKPVAIPSPGLVHCLALRSG